MNWEAVAAIAAGAALVFSMIQWFSIGLRNTLTYDISRVEGQLPAKMVSSGRKTRVLAEHYQFKNNGWKHLTDVKLKLRDIRNPSSIRVESTTSIDPEIIQFEVKETAVTVVIPSLPRNEAFSVDIIHDGWPSFINHVIGAGATYMVKSKSDFDGRRQGISALGWLVVAAIVIYLSIR